MNFIQVSEKMPNYGERVVVKNVEGIYFTAVLETDEQGDYWVYSLGPRFTSSEVDEEITHWAYPE